MDHEEIQMIGLEIVAYSGDARTKFIEAMRNLKNGGDIKKSQDLIEEGQQLLNKAHNVQFEMISKEAAGESFSIGAIFVHGQDHLMTTILFKDMLEFLMDIYKK